MFLLTLIAAGAQLLFTTATSYILDHVFTWLKIIFTVLLLDALFRILLNLSDTLEGLKIFVIYMENLGIFPIVPEIGVVSMLNMFVLFVSLKVLWMIFGGGNSSLEQEHIGGSKDINANFFEQVDHLKPKEQKKEVSLILDRMAGRTSKKRV